MTPDIFFDGKRIAKAVLAGRAQRLADHLYAAGVREDDTVAIMLRNEPAFVEIMTACNLLGVYFCTVNWHFLAQEVAFVVNDSAAKVLFIHADLLRQIDLALIPDTRVAVVPTPGLFLRQYGLVEPPAPAPDHFDYARWCSEALDCARPSALPRGGIAYTSGSTGRPKGVRRLPLPEETRAAKTEAREALSRAVFGIDANSRCLVSAPLYHSAPLSYTAFCASQGATLFLFSKFDAIETLATIEAYDITHAYLVPTMYQRLLRLSPLERARYNVSSLTFVASTGSPCAPDTKRAMIDWFGPVLYEAYASSETGYLTLISSQEALRKPGSAGKPVMAAQVRILDDNGKELPAGAIGLIYGRQPAYPDFTYVNAQAARLAIERDGLVTLGDMGYFDDDGYLFVCDRKNDLVISGGVNIYPAEIEAVINQMPEVLDCAVFGIPHADFGESLAAAIQLQPGARLDEEAVGLFLESRLAGYKHPRLITFHDSLPREDTGKIFKQKLRDPYWAGSGRRI